MFKIGNIEIKGNVVLAPMAGVCNSAFRKIIKEMGCSLVFAEMVSDKGMIYNSKKTKDMLYFEECERPIAQQIFGSDKDTFVEAAKMVYDIMGAFFEEKGAALSVDTRFAGTRADKTVRGSIHNISVDNFTPAALTKGVVEGMIKELYDMYKFIGVNINGIVGSGNGIRKNKALIKATEKRFGYNLKIPYHTEEAAFGAALYGIISADYYKNMSEARRLIKFI